MATTKYNNGEMVDIVAGKYKGMQATYLHKYGEVMCTVGINGVNRNIRLSSIMPRTQEKHDNKPNKTADESERNTDTTRRKEDIKKLQRSIEEMKIQLDLMQATLHSLMLHNDDD